MMKYDELLDCEELCKMAIYSCIWLRDVRTHLESREVEVLWRVAKAQTCGGPAIHRIGFDPFPYSIDFNRESEGFLLSTSFFHQTGSLDPISPSTIGFGGPNVGSPNEGISSGLKGQE
jgi:hypothetical protein